ncbi:YceI family protein [Undibacterium sp. SXout11W]|uniref:YceI family protein n=1 Tax=Undibacterium sp. SXout11W TaxID=3413050 RepID=UPI003BF0877C
MRKTIITAFLTVASFVGTAHADTATYNIDPTHTYVTFEVTHFGTSTNRGRFDKKEGTVVLDMAAQSGKVDLAIDTRSINTGHAAFDQHLQTTDFFDSVKYPAARFTADKISFRGEKISEVKGELTLLGKTRPVLLKATNFNCYMNPIIKHEVCGGDFETTIQRTQWGMNWGLDYGVPDTVKLVIQVEAVKQ